MTPKVSKGLATWAGLVAAVGQYALAVALFMDTFNDADPLAGLGPLATATVTLYGVIKGRMDQAKTLAARPMYAGGVTSAGLMQQYGALSGTTTTAPRPSANVKRPEPRGAAVLDFDEDDDPYPPAGPDDSIADPALDDPEHIPTTALHSRLKG